MIYRATMSRATLPAEEITDTLSTMDPQLILEELYDLHASSVHGWCRGMLGARMDADDAVQSIWLKLARRPERLTDIRDLKAYVWATARNHVHSLLRRKMLERLWTPPREEKDDRDWVVDPHPSISPEERRDLLKAVKALRPRFRSVVLFVAFEGCTLEEAAERLGIPRGTAASRYHTALQKIHNRLSRS